MHVRVRWKNKTATLPLLLRLCSGAFSLSRTSESTLPAGQDAPLQTWRSRGPADTRPQQPRSASRSSSNRATAGKQDASRVAHIACQSTRQCTRSSVPTAAITMHFSTRVCPLQRALCCCGDCHLAVVWQRPPVPSRRRLLTHSRRPCSTVYIRDLDGWMDGSKQAAL